MELANELAGKDVLVLGLGMSGLSAAEFCARNGARVVAADERPAEALRGLDALPADVKVMAGAPLPDPSSFDLVVPSPGVPAERYAGRARRAWGDIELAGRALAVPVVAVTGTNGKSTTVCLIEAMLRAAGLRASKGGNVGTPALDLPGQAIDVAVLEVSSFQLEAVESFRPRVAVVLNLTPDHLDRHGDFARYAETKRRILARQGDGDVAILNFDCAPVRAFAEGTGGEVVPVSARGPATDVGCEREGWLDAESIVLRAGGSLQRFPLDSLPLAGAHNRFNALAALTAAWVLGAEPARALEALIDFRGLPHRSEIVGPIAGVTFVNDSKATNPGAALQSLGGHGRPVIWIAGGRDKDLSFEALADGAVKRVSHALLIGEAAPKIEAALAGRVPCERCEDLEQAVARAAGLAKPGDVVLLAPACASFDQFASYEDRGNRFRNAALALQREVVG
ncbi:MAG: UDP-N-acetylmuramoyl-L-alanine--D-glutamate ligase [Deltaproteobacteria bacterium]|nr:UDP-N-acetylmuramoyl-L-alanine--D-glutamate ligase [Deltaproteobacteria bacterium]